MRNINRFFDDNSSLESIINSLIDLNLENEFNKLLNSLSVQPDVESNSSMLYNNTQKIDCVTSYDKKGGIQ